MEHGLAAQRPDPQPERQLDRVAVAGERLVNYNNCLQAFVDRYHGNPPGAEKTGVQGIPAGHVGQIAKLEDELMRLDKIVAEIQAIG